MHSEAEPPPPAGDATEKPLLSAADDAPPALTPEPAPSAALAPPVELAPPAEPGAVAVVGAPVARKHPSMVFLAVLTGLSLAADLATKAWAKGALSGSKGPWKIVVLKDHIDFIFAKNPGGAWSFLRNLP